MLTLLRFSLAMPSGTEKNCLELTQLYMHDLRFVHLSSTNGILICIPAHKKLLLYCMPYANDGTFVVRQLNSISIAQPVHKLCENHQALHDINKFGFCLLGNH